MSSNQSTVLRVIENGAPLRAEDVPLPSELVHLSLEFFCWGDLAKLACVQSEWKTIMYTVTSESNETKWELAQALFDGTDGLEKNPAKAMQLCHELANVGTTVDHAPVALNEKECFAPAMKKIAMCYLTGAGVSKPDTAVGLVWLQQSHTLGKDLDAAHELALIYEYGHYGVEIDVVQAATWFRAAAEAGHVEAMAELGLCYELGCGVEQSDEQALEWYMKAAEAGHLTAKYAVGEAFEEARGVPQSDEEACLWYYKAAVEGDEDSRKALRRLEDIARIVVPGVRALLDG